MKGKFSLMMTIAAALLVLTAFSYGQAGTDVKNPADDTGKATEPAAKKPAHATKKAAVKTGEATEKAADKTDDATEAAATETATATKNAAAAPRLPRCSPVPPVVKVCLHLELTFHAHRLRNSPQIPRLLHSEGTPRGALVVARPGQRPDAALYQRRHEPVQGRFPRPRKARLRAGHDLAEVRACRRQAQRSGKRRLHQSPSHVFRDAGKFFLWRLLQERRHRLRVGADYFAGVVWD